MYKVLGIALLVVGAILLYYGFQEGDSLAGEATEAITGSPPEGSVWKIVGGILLLAVGAGLMFVRPARP